MKFKKDRKKKGKQPEKKPRLTSHGIRFDESHFTPGSNTVEMSLMLSDEEGKAYAIVNGEKVFPSDYTISYLREGKSPKQLVRFEHDGGAWNLEEYFKQFDLIIAIDTNTVTIGGTKYHVGFAIQPVLCFKHKNLIDIAPLKKPNLVLIGEESKPENRNIQHLIQYIQTRDFSKRSTSFDKLKIGIITDSDLGSIPAINKREAPLIDDFYLPQNVQLVYASDAASDTLLNYLIKWCHKGANIMIEQVRPELENREG